MTNSFSTSTKCDEECFARHMKHRQSILCTLRMLSLPSKRVTTSDSFWWAGGYLDGLDVEVHLVLRGLSAGAFGLCGGLRLEELFHAEPVLQAGAAVLAEAVCVFFVQVAHPDQVDSVVFSSLEEERDFVYDDGLVGLHLELLRDLRVR